MNDPQKRAYSEQIFRGILYFQRKTRLIANELGAAGQAGPGISIPEGLMLHILEAEPQVSVKELAEMLKLDRSWVSRLAAQLEEKRLAGSRESAVDKRIKNIYINKKGEEALISLNGFRSQVMQRAAADLSNGEQAEFASLLAKLSDALKARRFIVTPHSHPIDAELARLSWVLGTMGENFVESGMGVAQFHIFEVIAESAEGSMLASDVNDLLPFDMSTISRSIVNFEKSGLVLRRASQSDRRSILVSLSRKGQEAWRVMKKGAVKIFEGALEQIKKGDAKRLAELFELAVKNMPLARAGQLRNSIEIKQIDSPELVRKAKEFSETNIFSSKSSEQASRRFILYSGNRVCGIASLSPETKEAKDDRLSIALSGLSEKECSAVIKQLNRWLKRS